MLRSTRGNVWGSVLIAAKIGCSSRRPSVVAIASQNAQRLASRYHRRDEIARTATQSAFFDDRQHARATHRRFTDTRVGSDEYKWFGAQPIDERSDFGLSTKTARGAATRTAAVLDTGCLPESLGFAPMAAGVPAHPGDRRHFDSAHSDRGTDACRSLLRSVDQPTGRRSAAVAHRSSSPGGVARRAMCCSAAVLPWQSSYKTAPRE